MAKYKGKQGKWVTRKADGRKVFIEDAVERQYREIKEREKQTRSFTAKMRNVMNVNSQQSLGYESMSSDIKSVSQFRKLSLKDMVKFLKALPKLPANTSVLQKLINALGLHTKPIIMSDTDFDETIEDNAYDMRVLYRGDNASQNKELRESEQTKVGAEGRVNGDGIHFTTSFNYATKNTRVNGGQSTMSNVVTAYIDKNKAKVIDFKDLQAMMAKEPKEVMYALNEAVHNNVGYAEYALYKGYNVIKYPQSSREYLPNNDVGDVYTVLDRGVLVIRDHTE